MVSLYFSASLGPTKSRTCFSASYPLIVARSYVLNLSLFISAISLSIVVLISL